ncbi:MAG TPA: hypothetical protein VGD06_05295 [Acidobacteriota bacterium]
MTFGIYLSVAMGIAISVVLPLIRAFLPKPPRTFRESATWATFRPHVATGVFSLVVAVLIVAFVGEQPDTFQKALIAGYTWDATVFDLGMHAKKEQQARPSQPTSHSR